MSEKATPQIVLDSTFLQGRVNPETNEILSILDQAKSLGWGLCIPEAVILELINGAREKLTETHRGLSSAIREVKRLNVNVSDVTFSIESELDSYKSRLEAFIGKNRINKIQIPARLSVEAIFQKVVTKQPPFNKAGNNFRDGVVWLSIESFSKDLDVDIYFSTGDQNFRELSKAAKPLGSKVNVMSPEELKAMLLVHQEVKRKEELERISLKIEKQLGEKMGDKVNDLIRNHSFSISTSADDLVSVDDFKIIKIKIDSPVEDKNSISFVLNIYGTLFFTVKVNKFMREARAKALIKRFKMPKKIGDKSDSGSDFEEMLVGSSSTLVSGMIPEPDIYQRREEGRRLAIDAFVELNKSGDVEKLNISTSKVEENEFAMQYLAQMESGL